MLWGDHRGSPYGKQSREVEQVLCGGRSAFLRFNVPLPVGSGHSAIVRPKHIVLRDGSGYRSRAVLLACVLLHCSFCLGLAITEALPKRVDALNM
jgi:hypothetical protein